MLVQRRLERMETNLMHCKCEVTRTETNLKHFKWGSVYIVTPFCCFIVVFFRRKGINFLEFLAELTFIVFSDF